MLTNEQVKELSSSLESQEIGEELLEIRYNSDGSLEECEGVFISGEEGQQGNEGIIVANAVILQKNESGHSSGLFLHPKSQSQIAMRKRQAAGCKERTNSQLNAHR